MNVITFLKAFHGQLADYKHYPIVSISCLFFVFLHVFSSNAQTDIGMFIELPHKWLLLKGDELDDRLDTFAFKSPLSSYSKDSGMEYGCATC